MPVLWPPSAPLIGSARGERLLRIYAKHGGLYFDVFEETLAAGAVDGTDSTDTRALRVVTDTGDHLSLDGDQLAIDGAFGALDPLLHHTDLASQPWEWWNAYAVLWAFEPSSLDPPDFSFSAEETFAGGDTTPVFYYANHSVLMNGQTVIDDLAEDETHQFMLVRRPDSAGLFLLYRNGTNPWRLAWMTRWAVS